MIGVQCSLHVLRDENATLSPGRLEKEKTIKLTTHKLLRAGDCSASELGSKFSCKSTGLGDALLCF
jgi:hypothetical protein